MFYMKYKRPKGKKSQSIFLFSFDINQSRQNKQISEIMMYTAYIYFD